MFKRNDDDAILTSQPEHHQLIIIMAMGQTVKISANRINQEHHAWLELVVGRSAFAKKSYLLSFMSECAVRVCTLAHVIKTGAVFDCTPSRSTLRCSR